MKIFDLFGGIYLKLAGIASVIAGVLFIKHQRDVIEELEHENEIAQKKLKITAEQSEFKTRVMADETEEMLDLVKEVNTDDKKITVDELNNL
jgi:hypothetical protein